MWQVLACRVKKKEKNYLKANQLKHFKYLFYQKRKSWPTLKSLLYLYSENEKLQTLLSQLYLGHNYFISELIHHFSGAFSHHPIRSSYPQSSTMILSQPLTTTCSYIFASVRGYPVFPPPKCKLHERSSNICFKPTAPERSPNCLTVT